MVPKEIKYHLKKTKSISMLQHSNFHLVNIRICECFRILMLDHRKSDAL